MSGKRILTELTTLPINDDTEFTLEGAPMYFWSQRVLLEDLCTRFPNAKKRISIGVQSFDPKMIAQMSRTLMNNKLDAALEVAKDMNIHTSIDLLRQSPPSTSTRNARRHHQSRRPQCPAHMCVQSGLLFWPWNRVG